MKDTVIAWIIICIVIVIAGYRNEVYEWVIKPIVNWLRNKVTNKNK